MNVGRRTWSSACELLFTSSVKVSLIRTKKERHFVVWGHPRLCETLRLAVSSKLLRLFHSTLPTAAWTLLGLPWARSDFRQGSVPTTPQASSQLNSTQLNSPRVPASPRGSLPRRRTIVLLVLDGGSKKRLPALQTTVLLSHRLFLSPSDLGQPWTKGSLEASLTSQQASELTNLRG